MKEKKAKKIVFKSADEMPTMVISIGSQTHNLTGAWRNIRPEIDLSKCLKCGICAEECPAKCIVMVEERK